MARAMM